MNNRMRNQAYLRQAVRTPDSAGDWLSGEDVVILPIASEPYDWAPNETGEAQYPQFIPVAPRLWTWEPALAETKETTEGAELILIDEVLPRKAEVEVKAEAEARLTYVIRDEPKRPRRRLVSSVLALLLTVILVFIFAWIAQK